MEDQGKRLLLAVVVAFGIMMVWSMLFPPKKPEKKQEAPEVAETSDQANDGGVAKAQQPEKNAGESGAAESPTDQGGKEAPAPPAVTEPEATPRAEEQLVRFEFKHFNAEISTYSGALKSWELLGKKFRDRDFHGKRQTNLAPTGDGARFTADKEDLYPFTIGFSKGSDLKLPALTEWTVDKRTETEVTLSWTSSDLHILKKFRFMPDDYLLELTVEVEKLSPGEAKEELVVTSFGYQDPNKKGGSKWRRVDTSWRTACYVDGELRTNSAKYLTRGAQTYPGQVQWAGFTHSYFLAAFAPRTEVEGMFECIASVVKDAMPGTMRLDLVFGPPTKLRQGKIYTRTVTAYLGPKYLHKLDGLSAVVGYQTGFENAVNLGWFAIIARPLLWLLTWFQSFVINWGVAIILLTIVVKLATLYWTTKSMRSMKAMADLKPEVEKIQKKYKDDKQRQQVEIMAMYKANKVSPLSGCLPMLLQMPIWFALYRTLMVAAELYQAPFIPGWINDLTAPDPYHVLPIALTAMMFVQSKLSPSAADSTQQKIMMYGMPLMFGVFSFFFPAGLTLYIFTNTCLTAVHHVWMNRTDKAKKAAAAQASAGSSAHAEENGSKGGGALVSGSASTGDDDDERGGAAATNRSGKAGQPRKSKGSKSRKRGPQKKKSGRRKRSA